MREKLKKNLKLLTLALSSMSPGGEKKGVKFPCKENYQILSAVNVQDILGGKPSPGGY